MEKTNWALSWAFFGISPNALGYFGFGRYPAAARAAGSVCFGFAIRS